MASAHPYKTLTSSEIQPPLLRHCCPNPAKGSRHRAPTLSFGNGGERSSKVERDRGGGVVARIAPYTRQEAQTEKIHPSRISISTSVVPSFSRSPSVRCRRNCLSSICRLAVVTGASKGIGLEVARQLALEGVAVVLTARDEKRGSDAVNSLCQESNVSNIVFHQLDVRDPSSVNSLANFIQSEFGRLDIPINNAAVVGVSVDIEGLRALNIDAHTWTSGKATNMIQGVIHQTYDEAVTCLDTNYYGCKRVTEALLPLLKLSTSGARIVNASSLASELKRMPNDEIRNLLTVVDDLDEERIEQLLNTFLEDLKKGRLEAAGWPMMLPAYSVSKMVLNVYTRILAKRHPEKRINCVRPGFVKSDKKWNMGIIGAEEGARGPVMLALLPGDGPTGCYFDQTNLTRVW